MARKRVCVVKNETLLMSGVASMVEEQPNLSVSTITADDPDLLCKLSDSQPTIIVVDGADASFNSRYPINSLLENNPGSTVIALTPTESQIRTYRQQRLVGASATDLLSIIAGTRSTRRKTPQREVKL